MTLLDIRNLSTYFFTDTGVVPSVGDVSYFVEKGETVGLVGESGCGKSVSALSIMQLIESPPGKIVEGEIQFEGQDLSKLTSKQMQAIRGNRIGMIFQEPMTSLNPVYTIGFQITEAYLQHNDVDDETAYKEAIQVLEQVGIPDPKQRFYEYPHQLSGGMRQRIMIAIAIICKPSLLIADEPTTALDVTIQAQILDLLKSLQQQTQMSILLITHDLGVIAEMAKRVVVMYAGKVIETASVQDIFHNPNHPYTKGLFESIPKIDHSAKYLYDIPGTVPDPRHFPTGCRFHPRCSKCMDRCKTDEPMLKRTHPGHLSACWLNEDFK